MNLLLAAVTGWGKSYHTQAYLEENLSEYERVIIADYKDEYTGLVETHEQVKRFIVGPHETGYPPEWWAALIENNQALQLPKYKLSAEQWREVVAKIVYAARERGDVLICIDEGHHVAPQGEGYPQPLKGLATTGRGEEVSSMWVTQRLQEIDETIISQCTTRLLGGFTSDRDRNKLSLAVDYPIDVHNPTTTRVPGLPQELHVDGEPLPVRRFENDAGDTVGSEWIFSNDRGELERRDTRNMRMQAPHYGPQGKDIKHPDYGDG